MHRLASPQKILSGKTPCRLLHSLVLEPSLGLECFSACSNFSYKSQEVWQSSFVGLAGFTVCTPRPLSDVSSTARELFCLVPARTVPGGPSALLRSLWLEMNVQEHGGSEQAVVSGVLKMRHLSMPLGSLQLNKPQLR